MTTEQNKYWIVQIFPRPSFPKYGKNVYFKNIFYAENIMRNKLGYAYKKSEAKKFENPNLAKKYMEKLLQEHVNSEGGETLKIIDYYVDSSIKVNKWELMDLE